MRGTYKRRAGRVVLVGPTPSVLLLSGRDPSLVCAPPFWFVPGGGAQRGETIEDAARREVYEEVGAELGDLGPVVWRRAVSFNFDGVWYEQRESFYVVRTDAFVPRPTALTELERRATIGSKWWPLGELSSTTEAVHPSRLAALTAEWLSSGPPATPVPID